MPATKRSAWWNTPLSVPDTGCREEGRFLLKQPAQKNYNLTTFSVYSTHTDTYKHKHCAAQMCFPLDPSAQRDMIIAVLQASFHTLYSKDIAYTGRNREKEISGWERDWRRSGTCPWVYFAKEIAEAILFTSKQNHDRWWTVSVGLHFHTRETPLLPQTRQTLFCPRHLFSPKIWPDILF